MKYTKKLERIEKIKIYEKRIKYNNYILEAFNKHLEDFPNHSIKLYLNNKDFNNKDFNKYNTIFVNMNYFYDFLIEENIRNSDIIKNLKKE